MFKKSLCVLLAVMMLFFGVNNSYFSPHKMDKVEAASIALGTGTVIAVDTIIKIIGAIAVTGIGIGLISEWSEMDIEAMLQDFHDWLGENITVLDSIGIDGTSALKEWAQTDEWEVIEGGGGSNPSPSPDNDENEDESEVIKYPFGINGTLNLTSLGVAAEAGNIAADKLLNQYVSLDEGYISLARQYLEGKVNGYETSTSTDSITKALQNRYQPALIELPEGYAAWSTAQIVKWNAENLGVLCESLYCIREESAGVYKYDEKIIFSQPVYCFGIQKDTCTTLYGIVLDEAVASEYTNIWYKNGEYYTTQNVSDNYVLNNGYTFTRQLSIYDTDISHVYSNVPIYDIGSDSIVKAIKKIGLGLSQEDLLSPFGRNYIDTDDEFGWASTAQLSPSELLALGYGIDMAGMNLSLASLTNAAQALAAQLRDSNPNNNNAEDTDPIIYPTVNNYISTYENVVNDPTIFPESIPSIDTPTDGSNPTPTTSPEDNGSTGNENGETNKGKWIVDLSKFFPFCIPFDLIHLISVLDAEPVAPYWEIPLQLPAYGIDYTFVIDLSVFEEVARIFRICETVTFVLSLILITRKSIRG